MQCSCTCSLPRWPVLVLTRPLSRHASGAAGKLVIINLQATKHDKKAEASGGVVIRARTDEVMRMLFDKLDMRVPDYVRQDAVTLGHKLHLVKDSPGDGPPAADRLAFTVFVHSTHGPRCELPMVKSVQFHFDVGLRRAAVSLD